SPNVSKRKIRRPSSTNCCMFCWIWRSKPLSGADLLLFCEKVAVVTSRKMKRGRETAIQRRVFIDSPGKGAMREVPVPGARELDREAHAAWDLAQEEMPPFRMPSLFPLLSFFPVLCSPEKAQRSTSFRLIRALLLYARIGKARQTPSTAVV